MLAHGNDEIDLLAVTTVAGNQSLEKVTRNARVVASVIGMTSVPIAAGADHPLVREPFYAAGIHGESGLDGPELPEPTVPLDPRHGVDLIVELLMDSPPGEITVLGVGPATNLALALRREPAIARRARNVVLMAGAHTRGNVTPAAEFNVHFDPHAAEAVLRAPWPVTMVGLDLTHQAGADARCVPGSRPSAPGRPGSPPRSWSSSPAPTRASTDQCSAGPRPLHGGIRDRSGGDDHPAGPRVRRAHRSAHHRDDGRRLQRAQRSAGHGRRYGPGPLPLLGSDGRCLETIG